MSNVMIKTTTIVLYLFSIANGAKILGLFPMPSPSHQVLGSALLKHLASRGHEVTMISPSPLKTPFKNYTDIHIDNLVQLVEESKKIMVDPKASLYQKVSNVITSLPALQETMLANQNLQKFLETKPKFDVVIGMVALADALLGISHTVQAPTILFSTIGGNFFVNYYTSNTAPFAYVPNAFLPFTNEMSFFERIINTLTTLIINLLYYYVNIPFQNSLLHKYFPKAPSVEELIDDVDLVLLNAHYSTETLKPYLPNIIPIGGFHLQEKQILNDDIKQYLDQSKQGVIFFSLGSNVKSSELSEEKLASILETFKKTKYNILWKFEQDLQNKPSNVKIGSWLPQRAILEHHNVIAFITHGGLGSTTEAIFHGVPMVVLPFFGDQMMNAAESVRNGYAVQINAADLNEKVLTDAIREITENPIYSDKIKLQSDIYKNQEINPMDKAVYWVEHVIKHKGAKHLKSIATKIPWYQYMLLDVFAFITAVLVIIMLLTYIIFKKIINICFRTNNKLKLKSN